MNKGLGLVFLKESLNDISNNSVIPLGYKLWAFTHGFIPSNAWYKGINKKNCKEYLPDFSYYTHAPYNNPKSAQKINKMNYRSTFEKFKEYLPHYYYTLNHGYVEPIGKEDCLSGGIERILDLLIKEEKLAFKLIQGRAGRGFIEAGFTEGVYEFNGHTYSRDEAVKFLKSLDGYLVSEYIQQHTQYKEIWDKTTHTVRVQTFMRNGHVVPVFSFIRIGSSLIMHSVSHSVDAGSYVGIIDITSGRTVKNMVTDSSGRPLITKYHMETGALLDIDVPHWKLIIKKCMEMHETVPDLTWLGWDIIVTDDSFRLIEVNTFSAINSLEFITPIKANEYYMTLFSDLFREKMYW